MDLTIMIPSLDVLRENYIQPCFKTTIKTAIGFGLGYGLGYYFRWIVEGSLHSSYSPLVMAINGASMGILYDYGKKIFADMNEIKNLLATQEAEGRNLQSSQRRYNFSELDKKQCGIYAKFFGLLIANGTLSFAGCWLSGNRQDFTHCLVFPLQLSFVVLFSMIYTVKNFDRLEVRFWSLISNRFEGGIE